MQSKNKNVCFQLPDRYKRYCEFKRNLAERSSRKVFPFGGTSKETKIEYITKSDKKDYRTFGKNGIAPGLQARSDTHKLECLHKGDYQSRRVYGTNGLSPTIPTSCGGHHLPFIAAERGRYNKDGSTSQRLEARKDNISNTLTSVEKDNRVVQPFIESRPHGFNKGGKRDLPNMRESAIQNELVNGIRRLTPTECERLQGFPDGWTKYGFNGKKNGFDITVEISDTQRYKTLGNAVTVNVIKAIIEKLL